MYFILQTAERVAFPRPDSGTSWLTAERPLIACATAKSTGFCTHSTFRNALCKRIWNTWALPKFRLRELGRRACTAHLTVSTILYLIWKNLEVRTGWPSYVSRHSGSGVYVGWIWQPCRPLGLTTPTVKIDPARLTARVMDYFGLSVADIFQAVSF